MRKGITGGTIRPYNIASPGETICGNGGTHINGDKCICPGGLVGRNCESQQPGQCYTI